MRESFIILVALLITINAVAAEKNNPFTNKKPSTAQGSGVTYSAPLEVDSSSRTVKISAEDCARLVAHKPQADVAYKAGVDVDGNYVTPADVSSANVVINVPSKVEFDIAFDPLDGTLAGMVSKTSLSIGRVSYNIESGAMSYNGKPLSVADKVMLGQRCREKLNQ